MIEELTRQINGVEYQLIHKEIQKIDGKRYSNSFWRRTEQVEEMGKNTLTLLCRIPDSWKDINLFHLTDSCFEGNEAIESPKLKNI